MQDPDPTPVGSLSERAVLAARWALIQRWGSRGLSFGFFVVLARLLDPSTIGVVTLAGVFIAFSQLFTHLGFGDALIQKKAVDDVDADSAFWLTLLASIGVSLLVVLSASVVADFVSLPPLRSVLQVLALTLPLAGLATIQEAMLLRELQFERLAARQLCSALLGGLAGVAAAASGYGVWSLVIKALVESFVGVLLLWSLSRWRPRSRFSKQSVRALWAFGTSMTASRLIDFLNQWSGNWIVGMQLGASQLGLYSIGQRSYLAGMDVLQAAGGAVMVPIFSKVQDDPQRAARGFLRLIRLTAAFAFPCFAGFGALSADLVPLLFGSQWVEASPILKVFAYGGVIFSIGYYNSGLFYAMGRADWYLRWIAGNAILSVLAILVGARWGAVGVAVAYVGQRCAVFPVGLWLSRKLVPFPLRHYLSSIAAPALATLTVVLVIEIWAALQSGPRTLLLTSAKIITGVALYAVMLFSTAPAAVREVRDVIQPPRFRRRRLHG
jgi:PST family polysaccharide transporter